MLTDDNALEMAVILTQGSRVSSEKLRNEGYRFRCNKIEEVLRHYFV